MKIDRNSYGTLALVYLICAAIAVVAVLLIPQHWIRGVVIAAMVWVCCWLKELEDDFDVKIITQNVDDLHERAGSSSIIHLHGELMKVCSSNDTSLVTTLPSMESEIHVGDKASDGSQLRPFIVWFSEPVPMIEPAIEWVEQADIFLIVGSSLVVYPAAGLVHYLRREVPIYVIDPKPVTVPSSRPIYMIQKGASEGMKEFISMVRG